MIEFLRSLRENNSEKRSSAVSHLFFTLQTWNSFIAEKGQNAEKVVDFVKEIFIKSKLIERIISIYEEDRSFLFSGKISNPTDAESFAQFAIFILTNIKTDPNFLHESKNIEFTKCLIEDALNIETSLLSGRTVEALSSTLEKLYSETEIVKKFDNYKLFFMFVRCYINKPCLEVWEEDDFWDGVIRNLRGDDELLIDLLEEFLEIFEKKVKNPGFDLENALKEFEVRIGKRERRSNVEDSVYLEKNGEDVILDGESMQKTFVAICRRILPLMSSFTKSFEDEEVFKKYSSKLQGMVKKTISFGFSPISIFGTEAIFFRNIKSSGGYILDAHERYFSPFLEGILTGVINLCEEFKLNEESTMKKINIQRICEMLLSTYPRKLALRAENIPQDIRWVEAALISLIQAQSIFIETLNNDFEPPFHLKPEIKNLLQKATMFSVQFSKNFYQHVAGYLAEESVEKESKRLDILSMRLEGFLEKDFKLVKNWTYILDSFYKEDDYKEEVRRIYEGVLENIFLIAEDTEVGKRTQVVYNSFIIHEIATKDEGKGFIKRFLLKEENLERVLEMVLHLLTLYAKFENSFNLALYEDHMTDLVEIIQMLDEEEDDGEDDPQISGVLLEKIVNFIGKLNSLKFGDKRSERLNEQMSSIFKSFQAIYEFYIESKTDDKDDGSAENKSNTEEEGESLKEEKEEEEQEEEEWEDVASSNSKKEEEGKQEKELTEQEKEEIIKYAKVMRTSEFLEYDHINWFLDIEEIWRVLSKELWLAEYERVYKTNIKIILAILSTENCTTLKDLLQEEIGDELVPVPGENISSPTLKKLIQVHWIFSRQKLFFTEKLSDELKLSQNFIEGMTWAVEKLLREILTYQDDLTKYKSEMRDLDTPRVINELLTNTGHLLLDYIVASVSEKLTTKNEDFRRLLLKTFDLVDRYFEVHQYFIEKIKWDILLEDDCFEILMNCLTAALKSNKDLRVDFLNRESFYKLLTMKRLGKLSEKQLHAISFLTSILLEESLVLESDLELTLKEIAFKREGSHKLHLEDLGKLEKFVPFKYYKRTLEFLKPFLSGKSIDLEKVKEATTMKDYLHGKPTEELPILSYLQDAVSPVATKSIQVLFKALIENYGFEEDSKDSRIKYYQRKEQQKEKDERELQRREPLEICFDPEKDDKPVLKDGAFYEADLKTEKPPVKDTLALIVLLSSVMHNTPHLIPYMIFQKADMNEILQVFKNDEKMRQILDDKEKNWSMLDVLLRLALHRDLGAALYLIGGLINAEFLMNTTIVSGERLGDLVITKIYEVFRETLVRENSAGEAYKSLESVQMRKSMTIFLSYLNEKMKSLPYLDEKKQEIMQLNFSLIPSFLHNYALLAELTEKTDMNSWIIPDIANLIKSKFEEEKKEESSEEVEMNYKDILEAIEARSRKETRKFSPKLSELFDEQIFSVEKGLANKGINKEEQKRFEMWDEKKQWDKEEAKSILSYAAVWKSCKSCRDFIKLPIDLQEDFETEDMTLSDTLEDLSDRIYSLVYFYKGYQFNGDEKSKLRNLELDYRQDRHLENCDFLQSLGNADGAKSFKNRGKEELPKILRPDIEKAQDLEKQKNIFEDYLENNQEKRDIKAAVSEEKEGDSDDWTEDSKSNSEVDEEALERPKPKEKDNSEINYKYFVDKSVKSEGNFRFKINQALKKSRRVKEMICLEKKLGELLGRQRETEDFEEILRLYIQNVSSEFEKNVVYAALGGKISSLLSSETQEKIKNIQDELKSIKEDYQSYNRKLKETQGGGVSEDKKQDEQEIQKETPEDDESGDEYENVEDEDEKEENDESECDSKYDELDDDFEFYASENKKEGDGDENSVREGDGNLTKSKPDQKAIDLFRADDSFILEASKLFFSHFVISKNGRSAILELFGEALSLNPANEIKIFDTLLFILYSPECLEQDFKIEDDKFDFPPRHPIPRNSEYNPRQVYETTVENIIAWLCAYLKYDKRSDIFFMSKEVLDKFGNQLLKNLKEKTGFMKKISECSSILDMIISLLGTEPVLRNREWIHDILIKLKFLLEKKENAAKIFNLDEKKRALSEGVVLSLLDIAKDPVDSPTNRFISQKIREIFLIFKDHLGFALSLQEKIAKYFTSSLTNLNENLNSLLKSSKQGNLESGLFLTDSTMRGDLQVIEIIFSFLCNILHHQNLLTMEKSQVQALVESVDDLLFKQEEAKSFILNIYEVLEWKHKVSEDSKIEEDSFVLIILYHFSIVLMMEKYEKNQSQNELSSMRGNLPSLARLVSFEETESQAPLQRSFSSLRKELNVDFRAIFTNLAWKYSSVISKLNNSLGKNYNQSLSNAMAIIIPQLLWVIDFETKVALLENQMRKRMEEAGTQVTHRREIRVDRKALVHSAIRNFKECNKENLLQNLEISFKNEEGVDGGGLRREFFASLAKDLFDPRNGLFRVSDNYQTIQPSPFSDIVPNDLKYLEFAGIILAKAIADKIPLDLSFTKPFLKHILGSEINIRDLEDIDADLSKNLEWVLKNSVEDLHLMFTHEMEFLGERLTFELKEGGSETQVDEENKKEYVKSVCEFRMTKQIERQIQAFLKGFYSIIPRGLMSHLTVAELEIVISGAPQIDLQEMKKYANYRDYSENFTVIRWLWEILEELDQEKLATFYYYLSGSVKVPIGGFKQHPIKISRAGEKDDLPVAHTCSYELDLPEYEDKEKLREKLLLAIFDGAGGFYIS